MHSTLHRDEQRRANHRNEVQRQVHKVADNGLRRKLLEGLLGDGAQLANGVVVARLDLPALRHHLRHVLRNERLQ